MPDRGGVRSLRPGRPGGGDVQALLFDMDGTLSDTDPLHRQAMLATFEAQGLALSDEDFHRHVAGRSNAAVFSRFFPTFSEAARRALADEKEALFRRLTPRMTPMPGLEALLAWARAGGVACALVTNGPRPNVIHTLRALGLSEAFAVLVLAEELPRAKPDPLPYSHALSQLGVARDRAVAFEDSEPGVMAALAAGVFTVEITGPAGRAISRFGADLAAPDFTAPALWSCLNATSVHATRQFETSGA